jgi:hypothetical protein
MASAQRKGVSEGQAPQGVGKISRAVNSQQGRRQHGAGRSRKDESGMMKKSQRAQSEPLQEGFVTMYLDVMLLMLKLILHLFQETKSYGVKTICIHPLTSRRCTSHHYVWHNLGPIYAY